MQKSSKIIIIVVSLIIIGGIIFFESTHYPEIEYTTIANTSIGTVEVGIAGNENATKCIALITGIHPRETLSIDNYKVTVTDSPDDYEKGRANGESLVHDYVNPNVTASDADAVIISHSHNPEYGEGFYLATPAMDNASVSISEKISESSDFNYYPVTGNETYKSTSAVLVSKPIAQAGYPTFVYEIPEDIWESTATDKTKELFNLIAENI